MGELIKLNDNCFHITNEIWTDKCMNNIIDDNVSNEKNTNSLSYNIIYSKIIIKYKWPLTIIIPF